MFQKFGHTSGQPSNLSLWTPTTAGYFFYKHKPSAISKPWESIVFHPNNSTNIYIFKNAIIATFRKPTNPFLWTPTIRRIQQFVKWTKL